MGNSYTLWPVFSNTVQKFLKAYSLLLCQNSQLIFNFFLLLLKNDSHFMHLKIPLNWLTFISFSKYRQPISQMFCLFAFWGWQTSLVDIIGDFSWTKGVTSRGHEKSSFFRNFHGHFLGEFSWTFWVNFHGQLMIMIRVTLLSRNKLTQT